jgi:hypothetical protein
MKMNTRTLAFALALGVAGAANAQNISFVLGYGDNTTAALNGSSVGSAIAPGTTIKVGAIGTTSTFQIWVVSSSDVLSSGGNLFLAFDQATINHSTLYANNAAARAAGVKKAIGLGDVYSNLATGLAAFNNDGTDAGTTDIGPAVAGSAGAARFKGVTLATANTTSSLRNIGLNFGFATGPGINFKTGSAGVRLADITVQNLGIAAGDVYGDGAGETGLILDKQVTTNPANGATFLKGFTGNTASSYDLQAVPEPGTILAISAGLAALARRRKK